MVLISLQAQPKHRWAEALCSAPPGFPWAFASQLVAGLEIPSNPNNACEARVRAATTHSFELRGDLGAPLVEFRGKIYRGLSEFEQLKESLR